MRRAQSWLATLVALIALSSLATTVSAQCAINSVSAITPSTGNTGTYTPPTAPTAQAVTFTVNGTYNSLVFGTCTLSISFFRATLPATMARTSGGATLPYTIQTLAGGGTTLLYSGSGLTANRLQISFGAGLIGISQPFSESFTAYFLAQPGSPQREGSYSDSLLAAHFFNGSANGTAPLSSLAFIVNGTVAKACTIGGVVTATADAVTIPIGATGVVTTAPINRSYANAVCNAQTNLQVTSLNGGVRRASAAPSGFTNIINYTASASYSGTTSSLDTSTLASAAGAEAGTVGTTASSVSSGSISLTVVPLTPTQPLVPGSYQDTLRITLTPQ
jgi:hypothetical protein